VLATNGKEALARLEQQPFDIVLMDVQMPEMDGLQATAAIREREKASGDHIPIVAMTAHAMKGDRERCLAAGMDDYISKPIRASELYEVVERFATASIRLTRGDGAPERVGRQDESEPGMSRPILDWEAALAQVGGTTDVLRDLAELFHTEAPSMLQQIRTAIDAGEARELRRTAHTLKGSAAVFAAGPTVEAAQRLERMGEAGDFHGVEEAWLALREEVERLLPALREAARGETTNG
jgi:two-component system, sensor histidine kinase and response regulator